MKKMRTFLCLLLTSLMIVGVCGAFITANAVPDGGETTYYQITFALPDGGTISRVRVASGTVPEYNGRTTAQDDYFDYELTGWTPELAPAAGNMTYTALYSKALRSDEGAKSRLRGDANGDGIVDILDATTIQRYLAGLYDDPYGIIHVLGVTSGEDEVTILDATRIQRYLAGFANVYHIGEIIIPTDPDPQDPTDEPTDEPSEAPSDPPTQAPTNKDTYELPPI